MYQGTVCQREKSGESSFRREYRSAAVRPSLLPARRSTLLLRGRSHLGPADLTQVQHPFNGRSLSSVEKQIELEERRVQGRGN